MYSKKGSLQLSVNAIVVFVLAFAMLGVGLFLTNMIKEQVGGGVMSVVDINELRNPPSADDSITISREVTIKKGKKINLDVGYYNKDSGTNYDAVIGIEKCKSEAGEVFETDSELPAVISNPVNVGASEGAQYRIIFSLKGVEYTAGTYVCKMIVYSEDDGAVYDTDSFFLEVTS